MIRLQAGSEPFIFEKPRSTTNQEHKKTIENYWTTKKSNVIDGLKPFQTYFPSTGTTTTPKHKTTTKTKTWGIGTTYKNMLKTTKTNKTPSKNVKQHPQIQQKSIQQNNTKTINNTTNSKKHKHLRQTTSFRSEPLCIWRCGRLQVPCNWGCRQTSRERNWTWLWYEHFLVRWNVVWRVCWCVCFNFVVFFQKYLSDAPFGHFVYAAWGPTFPCKRLVDMGHVFFPKRQLFCWAKTPFTPQKVWPNNIKIGCGARS